jgi:hypothetical protein
VSNSAWHEVEEGLLKMLSEALATATPEVDAWAEEKARALAYMDREEWTADFLREGRRRFPECRCLGILLDRALLNARIEALRGAAEGSPRQPTPER